MKEKDLIPHLFRQESAKITAVLCKQFGLNFLETAEDITSETFQAALEIWPYKGIPGNPTAWLFAVAKHKAINASKRNRLFQTKISKDYISSNVVAEGAEFPESSVAIQDSQLQMMFCICHPAINPASQIALALRVLCGFGIEEIAHALLTEKETIQKRLTRAKEKLRQAEVNMEMPGEKEVPARLASVLKTIYLLFSEGYYSISNNKTLRKELCFEAMRLCYMLIENKYTNKPPVNALLSLMCFHASRLDARLDKNGEYILYDDQDTSLWDTDLISKGGYFLHCSASGNQLSKYHLEAAIAYWNTQKDDTKEKWEAVLQLYNRLLQIEYSPVAALNRTYALSKANGKEEAIREAEKLNLTNNHFYYTLLGELYRGIDDRKAREHLQKALSLAKTQTDKLTIQKKIQSIGNKQ